MSLLGQSVVTNCSGCDYKTTFLVISYFQQEAAEATDSDVHTRNGAGITCETCRITSRTAAIEAFPGYHVLSRRAQLGDAWRARMYGYGALTW